MKTNYTDEDVERLVDAVTDVFSVYGIRADSHPDSVNGKFVAALKPFQSDPEEELIEAMAKAYAKAAGDPRELELHPSRIDGIRAALTVVKERGLPQ